MTIEIEPDVLAEIKEQAKDWLDFETKIYERVLQEKRWDVAGAQEHDVTREFYIGTIAHRIVETLYPKEHNKLMDLISDVLNTMEQVPAQAGGLVPERENEQIHNS